MPADPASIGRNSRAKPVTQEVNTLRIHWPRTLAVSRHRPLAGEHLRYRRERLSTNQLHCFVIDGSSSMMRAHQLATLKGLLLQWSAQIYRDRDALAAIEFGGRGARVLRTPGKATPSSTTWVDAIEGGGGTPVHDALMLADVLLDNARRKQPQQHRVLWLLSDVRFVNLPSQPRNAHACRVVDFDTGPLTLSRAGRLARLWGVRHEHASDWIDSVGTL